MVKDHSDSGLLFPISNKGSLTYTIWIFPTDRIVHTTAFVTPVIEHWLERCFFIFYFLINDALNTFYLWLYGVRHMVKDHSDSEKGNPLPPHRLLFPINSKGSFICTIPQTDSTYQGLFYNSRGALAGTRNSSMDSPHEGSIRRPIAP